MFRKADLGRIILAKRFYDVLYRPEVPDGEKEPGWTTGRSETKFRQTKKARRSEGVRLQTSEGFNTSTKQLLALLKTQNRKTWWRPEPERGVT